MDPNSLIEEYSATKGRSNYGGTEAKIQRTSVSSEGYKTSPIPKQIRKASKPSLLKEDIGITPKIKGRISEKEIKEKVENLRMQQNHEMLLILEEEQANEANREAMMTKIMDTKEKKRLEKIFGMERAKAQTRIQELSE